MYAINMPHSKLIYNFATNDAL